MDVKLNQLLKLCRGSVEAVILGPRLSLPRFAVAVVKLRIVNGHFNEGQTISVLGHSINSRCYSVVSYYLIHKLDIRCGFKLISDLIIFKNKYMVGGITNEK